MKKVLFGIGIFYLGICTGISMYGYMHGLIKQKNNFDNNNSGTDVSTGFTQICESIEDEDLPF